MEPQKETRLCYSFVASSSNLFLFPFFNFALFETAEATNPEGTDIIPKSLINIKTEAPFSDCASC